MSQLFHTLVSQPLFNLLVFFYNVSPGPDIGIAIIFLTLLIKLIFYPLTRKSLRHQKSLQAITPELKKLREQYKAKPELLSQETMKLYRDQGVSPFGGCLPLLIQIPILFGLFQVFRTGFSESSLTGLYSFISNPGMLNPLFAGFIDLSQKNTYLAFFAGVTQFVQGYFFTPKIQEGTGDVAGQFGKQMIFMAPALTFIISLSLPAALPFYWAVNTLFTIAESLLNERFFP